MKILMVASESSPLAKTGGLADVVYALSKELAILGEEVSVVMPFYGNIKRSPDQEIRFVANVQVPLGWRFQNAKVYKTFIDGITFYLLENEYYFGREGFYGYDDDTERFAFFSVAVRNMMQALKIKPDVVHVHDYHGGMVPALIKIQNSRTKFFNKMKFVVTIHNPAFQGEFHPDLLPDFYDIRKEYFDDGTLRYRDKVNALKAAIVFADKINTVSPTHAEELLTPEGSKGLDGILKLRKNDFSGILNGIDYDEFNPQTDKHLPFRYGKTRPGIKTKNKLVLFKELGIKGDVDTPLFSMVSRLTWQKGIDLVLPAIVEVLEKGGNVVVVGSGEHGYEQALEELRARYPDRMAIYIGYNNPLAHRVYAASDFFFMPSLFEPCGIGQMIAQRYGTLPIVRTTGGLKDTVIGYDGTNEDVADGFVFDNYDEYWMKLTTNYALEQYKNQKVFKKLRRNAMEKNNDWSEAGKKYLALYKSIVK
ncbi:MAG: glycogen synthase [Bacilli bacterium]|jgi:starch synthase|nr:glycogen synthase [Bacilli bacterium]HOE54202.1 glycogen synthase [Bacilli bacterium]HOM32791.1 glycogen synthase [Bacilli bacterium]